MAQYIDKDALVVEIERMLEAIEQDVKDKNLTEQNVKDRDLCTIYAAQLLILRNLAKHLNTLEVKEVDLEKYYHEFLQKEWFGNLHVRTVSEMMAFTAKHFFELGLKARIDKKLVKEVYSHLDGIKDTADRMTSSNFMHNRAAIKFSANTIAKVLELMGLKAQKEE